ncbi:MAG: hypothetical protein OES09_10730 [Gammaproteobacteria bacterium]|nr:hypothetical protein [Gammaproteobacteria bacterium]
MSLTKAIIEILDTAAVDPGRNLPQIISVQFNPTEISLRKAARFSEIRLPGLDSPLLQFAEGRSQQMVLNLFFDTTRDGMSVDATDVRTHTAPLLELAKVQPAFGAPPRIRFSWGAGLSLPAVVTSVKQRFTLFNPDGVPLRAEVQLVLKEYRTLKELLAEQNRKGADRDAKVGGVPDQSDRVQSPDLYRPGFDIFLDGRPLAGELARDVMQVTFRDSEQDAGSLEFTINNWDTERRAFKYSNTRVFEVGQAVEVRMGYRDVAPLTPMFRGKITAVKHSLAGPANPHLRIRGSGATQTTTDRNQERKPVALRYGESLIRFEAEEEGDGRGDTGSVSGTAVGLSALRVGVVVAITGVGKLFTGAYRVMSVRHVIDRGGYRTDFDGRKATERTASQTVPMRK